MSRRLSAAAARRITEGATLVKHESWPESRRWQVVAADGTALVIVEPAYSAGRRDGWSYWLVDVGPGGNPGRWGTREQAAVTGLGAWERWATSRGER